MHVAAALLRGSRKRLVRLAMVLGAIAAVAALALSHSAGAAVSEMNGPSVANSPAVSAKCNTLTNQSVLGPLTISTTAPLPPPTPLTTATLSPPPLNGYYNQDPTVALGATDLNAVAGVPGVAYTCMSTDGSAFGVYVLPFQITGDGPHTLQFYSVDNDGNVEATNTLPVDIDTTPPVTVVTVSPPSPISGTGTVAATPTDNYSGVASTTCTVNGGAPFTYAGPFTVTTGGIDTAQCLSTDVAGNVEHAGASNTISFQINPQTHVPVNGNVPSTLSVSVSSAAPSLGAFTAGVAATYTASVAASVTSTAATSTLTAADTSATCPGYLVNSTATGAPYCLSEGLRVDATDTSGVTTGGGVYSNLAGTDPATLLSYSSSVANDPVTIGFMQALPATQPLRTGVYAKTITIALSTSTP